MSYDIRICVRTIDANKDGDSFAIVYVPKYDSPTYNLRSMFVACMDWDYIQGEYYPLVDVLPKLKHGLAELTQFPEKYSQYEAKNGWGTLEGAVKCIDSWIHEIEDDWGGPTYNWDIESLWWKW